MTSRDTVGASGAKEGTRGRVTGPGGVWYPYRMPPTRLPEEQIRRIEQIVITYLDKNPSISNTELRALAGMRYDQATYFFNRMLEEGKLQRTGKTSGIRYV